MEDKTLVFESEKQAKGFTQIPNHILLDNEIHYRSRLLFAVLLKYAWDNRQCFPGQTRLAEDIGVSQRSIRSWLSELERHGLIGIKRRGLNKTNVYIIKDLWAGIRSDRKQVSGQKQNVTSGQEQNEASDKEDSVEEDSVEEDTDIYANEISAVHKHWLKKLSDVNKAKLTARQKKAIAVKLNKWPKEAIAQAIDNYNEVYRSDYYYSHNFTLYKFIKQKNGAPRFLPGLHEEYDGDIYKDYQEYKKKQANKNGKVRTRKVRK